VSLRLTNSLSNRTEAFNPLEEGKATIYCCGVTVYDLCHLGHARSYINWDVLRRYLIWREYDVTFVQNYTDIDDKILNKASSEGTSMEEVSEKNIKAFEVDMARLNILPADRMPRATRCIPEIQTLIKELEDKGAAYGSDGDVYFDVSKAKNYGQLSGRDPNEQQQGASGRTSGNEEERKRHPFDFALWKSAKDGEPSWDSPWGPGRPGWHIECSAMIEKHLGESIDIHGGGQDLIFPHHENEIAQGTCAYKGKAYCQHWVHNGFVTVEGKKMSKSLGNVVLVRDLLPMASGEAIRFALLGAHYRQPLDWHADGLAQATRSLDRLYAVLRDLEDAADVSCPIQLTTAFVTALEDDLNFPKAIAELFKIAKAARRAMRDEDRAHYKAALLSAGSLLGLLQQTPAKWFADTYTELPDTEEIQRLINARLNARAARDYAKADQIRDKLADMGIAVQDSQNSSVWQRTC